MKRYIAIKYCNHCRYFVYVNKQDRYSGYCVEANRPNTDSTMIPTWCPLPTKEQLLTSDNIIKKLLTGMAKINVKVTKQRKVKNFRKPVEETI